MSKSRLLLLLNHRENQRLLVERLTPQFDVTLLSSADVQTTTLTEEDFDLVIFDLAALGTWRTKISGWRQTAEPLFLPTLALLSENTIGSLPLDIRYQIDELITLPVDPSELNIRINVLLRSRRLSSELNRQNQRLAEMNTLRSRFVSMVSHEFRNPLSVISGIIQLLKLREQSYTAEKKQEMFERMQTVIVKLTALLDDLLILSRNASSQATFKPVLINLKQHCQELLNDLQFSSKTHSIDFTAQGELDRIWADAALIDTILNNLLSNAIKYSPPGSTVSLHLSHNEGEVTFTIEDQGQGIPLEDRSALFDAFFRARNVGAIPGTGLGLSIVKQCVELHGGTIAVDSQVDRGTTFIVRLPSARDEDKINLQTRQTSR